MKFILAGHDEKVARWMCERVPFLTLCAAGYTAIGLMDETGLIAGVMYDNYRKYDIHMHVAAVPGSRWMTKTYLQEVFRYPFEQLGVTRITGLVAARNWPARKFDEHIGFVHEGTMRKAFPDGDDVIIYGMLHSECRYIGRHSHHGKEPEILEHSNVRHLQSSVSH